MTDQRFGANNRNKTHCKRGHPFGVVTTYLKPSGGRQCLLCKSECAALKRGPKPTAQDRFWRHVEKQKGGCWLWIGALDRGGYGKVRIDLRDYRAHRVSYEWARGTVPSSLQLDHLCRVRNCVNPDHLEPVTAKENIGRAVRTPKTHCPQGHPYSPENTCVSSVDGSRKCKTCRRMREAARRPPRIEPTYCRNGHPIIAENRYPLKGRTTTCCKLCVIAGSKRYRASKESKLIHR